MIAFWEKTRCHCLRGCPDASCSIQTKWNVKTFHCILRRSKTACLLLLWDMVSLHISHEAGYIIRHSFSQAASVNCITPVSNKPVYFAHQPALVCFDISHTKALTSKLYQRTSGPVNAHLTPGPGIYFNAFIHVYSPRAGTNNPLGTADVNRKPLSLCPFDASFKMISSKSDFIHIFNDFIHVYNPRARAYNPLWTNFWCQQKALITLPIHCKLKKKNLTLYTFLIILYMYITPGLGQTTLGDKLLMSRESPYHFAHLQV